jgi:SSS family solute:Na+ symporter
MFDTLIAQRPELFRFPEQGLSASWYVSTILMTVFGFYMWPHTFASLFTARSDDAFRRNAVLMPLYQLVLLFAFFIGFAAIGAVPGLQGTDIDLALLRVTRQTFGPWVLGLVGAAGLLTALVPGSLILMSTATILARLVNRGRSASDLGEVQLARSIVPVVGAVALFFVFRGGQTIVTLLLFAYAIVTQLFPAVAFSLLWPQRTNAVAALSGLVTGLCIVAWATLTETTMATLFPTLPHAMTDVNIAALALVANVVVVLLLSFLRRNPRAAAASAAS